MTTSLDIRARIVSAFRRDLVGPTPNPEDEDLAAERLNEQPSRWYLTGFLAPAEDELALDGVDEADGDGEPEERELDVEEPDPAGAGGAAGDDAEPEAPNARRRFLPSSVGLTVLLDPAVTEIEAKVCWGDYRTEPPMELALLAPDPPPGEDGVASRPKRPDVEWVRVAKTRTMRLPVKDGRPEHPFIVPESASEQRPGGALVLETHSRVFNVPTTDGGTKRVRALTVFLVNRRDAKTHRRYADIGYAFQARLELICPSGFEARRDLSGLTSNDPDLRIADLHYRDVCEWAVGRNAAAAWGPEQDRDGKVDRVWTDPLPVAEVERVAPNEEVGLKAAVTFGMETLAELAWRDAVGLKAALEGLPKLYGEWIGERRTGLADLSARRRETAGSLIEEMEIARARIAAGIEVLTSSEAARRAFAFMNLAVARAARRRNAGPNGDPAQQRTPEWRPFQLAFILLNLSGLADSRHPDRETADLLFFPTGGGKTEAYLGIAAFTIALRRLRAGGVLGAGVAVIMRYTLRLLTLDQLARAAGVICALELMRTDPEYVDARGERLLGD